MTQQPFIPPELHLKAFNCPYCKAYAQQNWPTIYTRSLSNNPLSFNPITSIARDFHTYTEVTDVAFARCSHCSKPSLWIEEMLVHPKPIEVSPAHRDLPDDIKADYTEASLIVADSPRGAAALLRLCIQKICKHLGEPGKILMMILLL